MVIVFIFIVFVRIKLLNLSWLCKILVRMGFDNVVGVFIFLFLIFVNIELFRVGIIIWVVIIVLVIGMILIKGFSLICCYVFLLILIVGKEKCVFEVIFLWSGKCLSEVSILYLWMLII